MKVIRNKKLFIILLSFIFLFLIFFNALAEYEIEVSLPGAAKGTPLGLIDYLRKVYLIALGAVGVAALLMLVVGGFTYMLSDTVTSKESARSYIVGAISGLVLALAAYLILYTINPDLVNWQVEISEVNIPSSSSFGNWQGKCANYPYGEIICLGNTEEECTADCTTKCQEFFSLGWKITEPCVNKNPE